MTSIEVLSTSRIEESGDQLHGAGVDGTEKIRGGITIVGWALGREARVAAVRVLHEGRVVANAGLGEPRPDAALAYPDVPEARSCGFRVPVTSDGLPDEFELALEAVLEGEETVSIGLVRGRTGMPSEEVLIGDIDGIEQVPGQVRVLGWALAADVPVSGVEISHDGRVVAQGQLGVERPDIAEEYPGVENASRCGFRIACQAADIPEEFELEVTVVLQDGRRVALGQVSGHRKDGGWEPNAVKQTTPTLRPQLRELVLGSAAEARLHDLQVPQPKEAGVREDPSPPMKDRLSVLDQLELKGKRVLVLDSGTGELSRAAAARGATLVDGFERDAQLIGLARLLNAYYGVPRVSFFCRDAADPASYGDTYDVVLALEAPERLGPALEAAARATDGIFVTEIDPADSETGPMLEEQWPHRRTLVGPGGGAAPGADDAPPSKLTVALAQDERALRSCLERDGDHREGRPAT